MLFCGWCVSSTAKEIFMAARSGDLVRVHYKGTLSHGTVFDAREGREPLEFPLGEGMVIPGFDPAVTGLEVGQSVVKTIPADEAYGQLREEMVLTVGRDRFPEDMELEVDQELQLQGPGGDFLVRVAEINTASLTPDGNHPFACQYLPLA